MGKRSDKCFIVVPFVRGNGKFIVLMVLPFILTFSSLWISNLSCECSGQQSCFLGPTFNKSVPDSVLGFYTKVYPKNGTGTSVDISGEFDFELFNSFCMRHEHLQAVIPVYSRPDGFKTRAVIRNTLGVWANKLQSRVFFIVGMTLNGTVYSQLKKEYAQEKDILVIGWVDTYRDLNNKAFAMIDWISRYCRHVPYVIHLIDDVYVNLEIFFNKLKSIKIKNYMLGGANYIPTVRKSAQFDSVVSVEEYPLPYFPLYAMGSAYAFPSHVAGVLLSVAFTAPYCWIEDVWIGGHVREEAKVTLVPFEPELWTSFGVKGSSVKERRKMAIVHSIKAEGLMVEMYAPFIK